MFRFQLDDPKAVCFIADLTLDIGSVHQMCEHIPDRSWLMLTKAAFTYMHLWEIICSVGQSDL